jgi:hypothetical protein
MWALQFLGFGEQYDDDGTLRLMMKGSGNDLAYRRREEKGVQTPEETPRRARESGFCAVNDGVKRTLGIAVARPERGRLFVQGGGGLADGGWIWRYPGRAGGREARMDVQAYLLKGRIDFGSDRNSIVGIELDSGWNLMPQQSRHGNLRRAA